MILFRNYLVLAEGSHLQIEIGGPGNRVRDGIRDTPLIFAFSRSSFPIFQQAPEVFFLD